MSLKDALGLRTGFLDRDHEALLNLYYTASRVRKRGTEFFRHYGLTDVQFNVLMLLAYQAGEDGGLNQVELGRMMLVNRANVTALMDRMEQAGLVRRTEARDDRRQKIIRLTPKGRRLFEKVIDPYQARVRDVMGVLDADETRRLSELLDRVRERLDA